jgi:hypothetical protein
MSNQTLKDVVRDIVAPMVVHIPPFSQQIHQYIVDVVNGVLKNEDNYWFNGFHTRWMRNEPPLPLSVGLNPVLVDALCARRHQFENYISVFVHRYTPVPPHFELSDEQALTNLVNTLTLFMRTHLHSTPDQLAETLDSTGRLVGYWFDRGELPDKYLDQLLIRLCGWWTRDGRVPEFSFEVWYQFRMIASDMIERALQKRVSGLNQLERRQALDEALMRKRRSAQQSVT